MTRQRRKKRKEGTLPAPESATGQNQQQSGAKDGDNDNPTKRLKGADLPSPISRLRLEAIFHPKFENERSDHQIRKEMLSRIDSGKGYLEVSLKHSGSLVLWSGGQRFYSKNSTNNQFTYAAEILLLQHFERAWRNLHEDPLSNYHECSKYAEENRLTLAFELVTAVLGDHGDIPKRDFIVLTAVADKAAERFYTTNEVMRFAQRYRLPHNDAWMFSSQSSAEALFHLYDTKRETGMARDTIQALTKAAEAHVPSMYPHVDFQGDILEGYIIRFVPFRSSPMEEAVEGMGQLASEAQNILDQLPVELPPSFEVDSISKRNNPVLSVDIRTIFQKTDGPRLGLAAADAFASELRKELAKLGKRTEIERVDGKLVDLPSQTEALTKSIDEETKRIALLLQKLTALKKAVSYTFLQEEQPLSKEPRHICVIHILFDAAFMKYQQSMKPGDMPLFRGFSIEISGEEAVPFSNDSLVASPEDHPEDGDSLMLKMKLLPYMVRTFICRNGLSIAQNRGSKAFVLGASNLMNRWGISSAGKDRWIPFCEAWADYAVSCFEGESDPSLPPLSDFSYLAHLEKFTNLYERGELKVAKKSSFRGFVCIIAPKASLAESFAKYIGSALDGATVREIRTVARLSLLRGVVCYGGLLHGSRGVKSHLQNVQEYLTIILFGCKSDEIKISLIDEPSQVQKQMQGLCNNWRKQQCADRVEVPLSLSSDFEAISDTAPFQDAISRIQAVTPSEEAEKDTSPGLLVFFPGIPGCGKSSVVSSFEPDFEELRSSQTSALIPSNPKKRILVRVSDNMKGSYWKSLKIDLKKDPSCILVADKNTPPPSWMSVVDLCRDSNAMPLAVLPDSLALQTTEIRGLRKPDGSFDAQRTHLFPFSLAYLAVCLSRVLARKPKSHAGKLDSGTPNACMIVIMFFSLYRHISADSLKETIDMKLSEKLSREMLPPIEVPFFEGSEPVQVPAEVEEVLVEALQLQLGYDSCNSKPKIHNEDVRDMEARLRTVLGEHSNSILSKTASIENSRETLCRQVFERTSEVQNQMEIDSLEPEEAPGAEPTAKPAAKSSKKGPKKVSIKLVSLDVNMVDAHQVLKDTASGASADFLSIACGGLKEKEMFTKRGCYRGDEFVPKTHVTMAFTGRSSQKEMREKFEPVLNCEVDLLVTGILWNASHAAFAVKLPQHTVDDKPLPGSENSFPHITLWFAKGEKAVGSNDLPSLVEEGKAHKMDLQTPVCLRGKISFWKK